MGIALNDKERFILLAFMSHYETGQENGQVLLDILEQQGRIGFTPRCVSREGTIGMDIVVSPQGKEELREFENALKTSKLEWRNSK